MSDRESPRTHLPVLEGEDPTLRWYMERLKILNDVHAALGSSLDLGESLGFILDRVFDHLGPEAGAVFLRQTDGSFRGAVHRTNGPADGLPCPEGLVRMVAAAGGSALVLDARSQRCREAVGAPLPHPVQSLVAVPLHDPAEPLGLILLTSKLPPAHISEVDRQLLVSLASAAAMRVRTHLLSEAAAERRRLEEELELARRIQVALLPRKLPELHGYEILGKNLPYSGVSGDYYMVQERRGGWECVFSVADVCGKGVAASLLMASLEALSAAPIREGLDPDEIFFRVSQLLYERTPPERFATAFLAVLEPQTGRVRYANAGHNPALLQRASGESVWLHATGIPLGLFPGRGYGMGRHELGPGDALILYTDGVTEAKDSLGEEFGAERFAEVCGRHTPRGLKALAEALDAQIEVFTHGEPPEDDRTFLAVRRLPE